MWSSYWLSWSISDPLHHKVIHVRRPVIPESLVRTQGSSPPRGLPCLRPQFRNNIYNEKQSQELYKY